MLSALLLLPFLGIASGFSCATWENLKSSQNLSEPPFRQVMVNINSTVSLFYSNWCPDKSKCNISNLKRTAVYTTVMTWPDPRIKDFFKYPVPNECRKGIWTPPVIVQNAISTEIVHSKLYFEHGLMKLRERLVSDIVHTSEKIKRRHIYKPVFQFFDDGSVENIILGQHTTGEQPATERIGWRNSGM